jgi:hypothetical protein
MYSPGGGVISIRSCRRLILLLTITSPHFGHCNLTNPLSFLYPIITCPQFVHRRFVGFHVFCITHKPSFLVTCRGMDLSSAYVRSRTPAPKKLISANHIQSVSAFNTFLYSYQHALNVATLKNNIFHSLIFRVRKQFSVTMEQPF